MTNTTSTIPTARREIDVAGSFAWAFLGGCLQLPLRMARERGWQPVADIEGRAYPSVLARCAAKRRR